MNILAAFIIALFVIAPAYAGSVRLECELEAQLFDMAGDYRAGHFGPWIDYKNHWHDSVKGGYTLQHAFRDLGSLKFTHAMPKDVRDGLITRAFKAPKPPGNRAGPRILNECLQRNHLKPVPLPPQE